MTKQETRELHIS